MIATFWVKTEQLRALQELIKAHDLRFVFNPLVAGDHAQVKIDGSHLSADRVNAFFADWDRSNTPIVEIRASGWKLWRNRIRSWCRTFR